MRTTTFVFILVFTSIIAYAQSTDCKVLLPELTGTYNGDCKNGLAHGKGVAVGTDNYNGRFKKGLPDGDGTYRYKNGDEYIGAFEKGLPDGFGRKTVKKSNGGDSLASGIWRKGVLVESRLYDKSYVVNSSKGLTRNMFTHKTGMNQIQVKMMKNGMPNSEIDNLLTSYSNGNETISANQVLFSDCEFPIEIKVRYTTLNATNTQAVDCEIVFTIFEPGSWEVALHN